MSSWKSSLIKTFYKNLTKPLLFRFDPEFVHNHFLKVGRVLGNYTSTRAIISWLFRYENRFLEQNVLGLNFRNPVGLSAGFDKNAELVNILPAVGFGFAEIGSVTMKPYEGNPKPRLYRLPKSEALVVYFGLMNIGVKKIASKIQAALPTEMVVGVSVAKTNCKETAAESAGVLDYFECLQYLETEQIGAYYTINISCPNTFGGEPFTTADRLEHLLSKVATLNIRKPVLIKMPINLPISEFDALLQTAIKYKISGVVIGNLTKVRDPELIRDPIPEHVKGGISGKPTRALANELIEYTYRHYADKLVIVGVGGIFSAEDAYEKICKGATLLQLITGMIFTGPQLIGDINRGLVELARRDGFGSISDAIGCKVNLSVNKEKFN